MAEKFGADEAKGVAETVEHAGEAVLDAVHGEWDKAADSALSMSESALGVATGGISTGIEQGLDGLAKEAGLGSAHDAVNAGLHAVGDALGDGLSELVGTDQSVQALHSFDSGDILGGVGHMAEGAADTISGAVSQGLSDVGDMLGLGGSDSGGSDSGGSDSGGSGGVASDGGGGTGQDASGGAAVDSSADPSGQAPDDGGAGVQQVSPDGG
jgi:hypothetical protein